MCWRALKDGYSFFLIKFRAANVNGSPCYVELVSNRGRDRIFNTSRTGRDLNSLRYFYENATWLQIARRVSKNAKSKRYFESKGIRVLVYGVNINI